MGFTHYFRQYRRSVRVTSTENIHILPSTTLPAGTDVVVFEEDTRLSLTPEEQLFIPEISNTSLTSDLMYEIRFPVGSVVRNGCSWNAVVHNLEHANTLKPENVAQAWVVIFNLIKKNNIKNIGVPLLGTMWGGIPVNLAVRLLVSAYRSHDASGEVIISVIVPDGSVELVSKELRKELKKQ